VERGGESNMLVVLFHMDFGATLGMEPDFVVAILGMMKMAKMNRDTYREKGV